MAPFPILLMQYILPVLQQGPICISWQAQAFRQLPKSRIYEAEMKDIAFYSFNMSVIKLFEIWLHDWSGLMCWNKCHNWNLKKHSFEVTAKVSTYSCQTSLFCLIWSILCIMLNYAKLMESFSSRFVLLQKGIAAICANIRHLCILSPEKCHQESRLWARAS